MALLKCSVEALIFYVSVSLTYGLLQCLSDLIQDVVWNFAYDWSRLHLPSSATVCCYGPQLAAAKRKGNIFVFTFCI